MVSKTSLFISNIKSSIPDQDQTSLSLNYCLIGEEFTAPPKLAILGIAYRNCIIISFSAVQVNSADQHLRVFDSAQKRWRQVCSSSANELLASISCEEVGFVR